VKLIVGLGNPGPSYAGTRHNVGFEVADLLAKRWGAPLSAEKFHAWFGQAEVEGERVVLLKPTTYMNRSGQAVQAAGAFYKLELSDLLVVVDDFAIPLGRLRMRASGSAGGHNGLQDILDRLGSEDWCRLRIGIGEPLGMATGHVLDRFGRNEREILDIALPRAADAIECWITQGPEAAMTRYNGDPPGIDRSETADGTEGGPGPHGS